MNLGQLIERLEAEDPEKVVPMGFRDAKPDHANWEDVAFVPATNVTVGRMLRAAKNLIGREFPIGSGAGKYCVSEKTSGIWIAEPNELGETLGPILLDYMLGKYAVTSTVASEEAETQL